MKTDPYANEPAVELDRITYMEYCQAQDNAAAWKKEAERLEILLNEQLGDAHAGLVDNRKVITHRPMERWREAALVASYPEITQHFMQTTEVTTLNMEQFRKVYPEIADEFQSRSFRRVKTD